MGSNCCSDKIYNNNEENRTDDASQISTNLDFPKFKSSSEKSKMQQVYIK